jgi:hypothetical protein
MMVKPPFREKQNHVTRQRFESPTEAAQPKTAYTRLIQLWNCKLREKFYNYFRLNISASMQHFQASFPKIYFLGIASQLVLLDTDSGGRKFCNMSVKLVFTPATLAFSSLPL